MKVAIIDDEKKARILLRILLEENCPEIEFIEEAEDLPTGVQLIHRFKPDIVFLDIEMPGYSGIQLLDFLTLDQITFELIFTTAYSEYAIKAFELNAIDYLLKPLHPEQIEQAVQKVIKKKGQTQLSRRLEELKDSLQSPDFSKIAFPLAEGILFVNFDEIILLVAERMYTKVFTQKDGVIIGTNKVAKLMKEQGLSAKRKKAYKPKTTINNPNQRKSDRIFKIEETKVTGENQVWVSDLTYLSTANGFSYLVTVMDLFNREIKGWNVSNSMNAVNTKDALLMAIRATSGSLAELIFHSDQGIQYCASEVREKLKFMNITQSMSRKGNCYDNAFAESFFGTMKTELEYNHFANLDEAKREIFMYINWYNRERFHSSLGYLSPVDYARQRISNAA